MEGREEEGGRRGREERGGGARPQSSEHAETSLGKCIPYLFSSFNSVWSNSCEFSECLLIDMLVTDTICNGPDSEFMWGPAQGWVRPLGNIESTGPQGGGCLPWGKLGV